MRLVLLLAMLFFSVSAFSQSKARETAKTQVVEAACGQCQFKMDGKGCDLAVRMDGKSYYVDGTKLDDHGDAHAADGFCSAIRNAEVTGSLVDNRFKATSFKLLPLEEKKVKAVKKTNG